MTLFSEKLPKVRTQKIESEVFSKKGIHLHIRREDELHAQVSGNKYRKLKYNLLHAKKQYFKKVLTFGGAYSNHIAATAYACREMGLQSIGVIRGEELANKWQDNPTLSQAHSQGMQLHFVSRQDYRQKHDNAFINQLKQKFGDFYLIPEGGTNALAVKGCTEIISDQDKEDYDVICCAVGTGGTLAGIIKSIANTDTQAIGFSALKANSLQLDIEKLTQGKAQQQWQLNVDYTFGGYAKTSTELFTFIIDFKNNQGIQLEPIYSGKMLYGLYDLIKKNRFQTGTRILAIHTGGLQGLQSRVMKNHMLTNE